MSDSAKRAAKRAKKNVESFRRDHAPDFVNEVVKITDAEPDEAARTERLKALIARTLDTIQGQE